MPDWKLAPVIAGQAQWSQCTPVTGPFWPVKDLTARQRQVLLFMLQYHDRHAASPTARQIATGCGLRSPSTAIHHLRALEQSGWVQRMPRLHTAVHVVAPVQTSVHCDPLPVDPRPADLPVDALPVDDGG